MGFGKDLVRLAVQFQWRTEPRPWLRHELPAWKHDLSAPLVESAGNGQKSGLVGVVVR